MATESTPVGRWDGQQWVPVTCARCTQPATRTFIGLHPDRSPMRSDEAVPLCDQHFAEAEAAIR